MSPTAVPLRPIAKGSLTRLWIGVAAIALAAGGLAVGTLALATPVLVSAGITAALLFAAGGGAWSAFIRRS